MDNIRASVTNCMSDSDIQLQSRMYLIISVESMYYTGIYKPIVELI